MNAEGLHKLPAALFEIGKLIGSELDPGLLLSRIAELVCQLIGAKACSVMLLDADRKRLLAKAAYGVRTERMQSLSFRIGEGVAGWVVERGEPALIVDVTGDPRFVVLPGNQTPIASACSRRPPTGCAPSACTRCRSPSARASRAGSSSAACRH